MNITNIQDAIIGIYAKNFAELKQRFGFSAPLMPNISQRYFDNRVVIMGQETNTWYDNAQYPDFINCDYDKIRRLCLTDRTDVFVKKCVKKYGGMFWKFNRSLYGANILGGDIVEDGKLSHCWLNLFCIEKCRSKSDKEGRPSQNKDLAEKVMKIQKKLLYEVFEIIKPKLIVAVIGLKNDDYFINNALNAKGKCNIIPVSTTIYKLKSLSEFKILDAANCLHNTTIIRAYHPTYFMGYMPREYKQQYNETLMNRIREAVTNK